MYAVGGNFFHFGKKSVVQFFKEVADIFAQIKVNQIISHQKKNIETNEP